MKKNAKHAFSLAEALITLLIVCLITLASVPVITKKKRTINNKAGGAYYCTLNAEGKHVYYDTTKPPKNGKIDDIETWAKSSNPDECEFLAPINTKVFTVTLIGGGGAGGSGLSTYETVIGNKDKQTLYSHTVTDPEQKYQLTMIGGGGGSGYGEDKEDRIAAGGSAGGYISGILTFPKGTKLKAEFTWPIAAGKKGGSVDWGKKPTVGDPGGDATIYNETTAISKIAYQVKGAKSVTGSWCKDGSWTSWSSRCYDGAIEDGGIAEITADAPHDSSEGLIVQNGNKGTKIKGPYMRNEEEVAEVYHKWAKIKPGPGYYVPQLKETRGGGATGTWKCQYPQETEDGGKYHCGPGEAEEGYIDLAKIMRNSGTGGEAAFPKDTLEPNLGRLTMVVGKGGTSDENGDTDGGITSAIVYNKAGIKTKQLYAEGGKAGTHTKPLETPEYGQNSNWLPKGGGGIGACQKIPGKKDPDETAQRYLRNGKCLMVIGYGNSVNKQLCTNPTRDKNYCYKDYFTEANNVSWNTINKNDQDYKTAYSDYKKSTDKRTGAMDGDVLKGNKSLFTYKKFSTSSSGSQSTPGQTVLEAHNSFWYCSKNKAINAIKSEYNKTTSTNDLTYGTNFMCIFNPGEADETFKTKSDVMDKELDIVSTTKSKEFFKFLQKTTDTISYGGNTITGYKYKTFWSWIANGETAEESNKYNFEYECLLPEYLIETYDVPGQQHPDTAECTKSGDGTYFGAGGGGGVASEVPGYAGYGGSGAPGAVIVEW